MVLLAGAVASAAADGLSNSLRQFHDELQRHGVSLHHLALDTGSRDSVAWCQLRAALRRCNETESMRVAVLGGSMTRGHGVGSGERWSDQFAQLLSASLPCRVDVKNMAIAGAPITTVILGSPSEELQLYRPHIVVVDYSVNDLVPDILRAIDRSEGNAPVRKALEVLVRRLLAGGTAVIDVETWTPMPHLLPGGLPLSPGGDEWLDLVTSADGVRSHSCAAFGFNATAVDATHWPVLRHYALPTVAFGRAACMGRKGGASHWVCPRPKEDELQVGNCVHPGAHTHQLLALLVAHFIVEQLQLSAGSTLADECGELPSSLTPNLDTSCGLLPPTESLYFAGSEADTSLFPAERVGPGWSAREDVAGKPGWIGEIPSAQLRFTVRLRAPNGNLAVQYLRSYEGFGRARLWLDDDSSHALVLDGRENLTRTSQIAVANLRVSSLCGPSCEARAAAISGAKAGVPDWAHAACCQLYGSLQRRAVQSAICASSMKQKWQRFNSTASRVWGARRCELTEAGLRLRSRLIGWLAAANAKSGCLTKWDALLYQAGPACESFLGRVYACDLVPTEPETARAVLVSAVQAKPVQSHNVTFEVLEPRFKVVGLTAC